MEKDIQENIIKDFDEIRPIYEAFTRKTEGLVQELLDSSFIRVQSVTSRTKEKESLLNKLSRDGEKYIKLEDITDLSGVRITCWFLDQIPLVAKIIEDNFKVINELSIDKSEIMDPDRFGYLSLHYVVSLPANRETLQECKKYAGLYCEVQIRTILQHAWAEIEHDLGYKSKIEIPNDIKRKFYRLAGLLELADDEFQHLKKDIEDYSNMVEEKLRKQEKSILIDKVSLEGYIETSEIVGQLDIAIASYFVGGAKLEDSVIREEDLKILKFFNIQTIEELDAILKEDSSDITEFAKKWIGEKKTASVRKGISIFYLGYVLAAKTDDDKKIRKYITIFSFPSDQEVAERLISTYKEIQKTPFKAPV